MVMESEQVRSTTVQTADHCLEERHQSSMTAGLQQLPPDIGSGTVRASLFRWRGVSVHESPETDQLNRHAPLQFTTVILIAIQFPGPK
jgi:hypothetical protein